MIVPSGTPAWTRTARADDYGAIPGLHDLGNFGAVNAKTDITAAEYARMAADCVTAVRSAPLFWLSFNVITGPAVTVVQCQPMWDSASGSYAGATPPRSAFPTIVWSAGLSAFVLTFPGLVVTVDGVRYLRAYDAFTIAGDCQMQSPIASTANSATRAVCTRIDGAELRITGVTTGANVSLVVR
jgi:hypothetical protein